MPVPKKLENSPSKTPTLVEKYIESYKKWNKANAEHTESVNNYENYKNNLRKIKPTLFQILTIHNKANNMMNKKKIEQSKSKNFLKLRKELKQKYKRGKN
jgi:hypothetical protein